MEQERDPRQAETQEQPDGKAETSQSAEASDDLIIEADAASPAASEEAKPQNGQTVAEEAQSAMAELQDRFLRLAADFANYKRRTAAERAEIADWARNGL